MGFVALGVGDGLSVAFDEQFVYVFLLGVCSGAFLYDYLVWLACVFVLSIGTVVIIRTVHVKLFKNALFLKSLLYRL